MTRSPCNPIKRASAARRRGAHRPSPAPGNPATNTAIYPFPPTLANAPIPSETVPWYYPINTTPYMIQYNVNVQREVMANTVADRGLRRFARHSPAYGHRVESARRRRSRTACINSVLRSHVLPAQQNPRENPNLGYFPTLQPISYLAVQRVASLVESEVHAQRAGTGFLYLVEVHGRRCFRRDELRRYQHRHHASRNLENPFNQAIDHAACAQDIPQVLRINGLWALPFKGNRLVSRLAAERHSQQLYDGVPFNVEHRLRPRRFRLGQYVASELPFPADGISYPVRRRSSMWFNPNCYTLAASGTIWQYGPEYAARTGLLRYGSFAVEGHRYPRTNQTPVPCGDLQHLQPRESRNAGQQYFQRFGSPNASAGTITSKPRQHAASDSARFEVDLLSESRECEDLSRRVGSPRPQGRGSPEARGTVDTSMHRCENPR